MIWESCGARDAGTMMGHGRDLQAARREPAQALQARLLDDLPALPGADDPRALALSVHALRLARQLLLLARIQTREGAVVADEEELAVAGLGE